MGHWSATTRIRSAEEGTPRTKPPQGENLPSDTSQKHTQVEKGNAHTRSMGSLLTHTHTHLVHTVEELQEDGGEAAALAGQRLGAAVTEAVSERQPLLLH